MTDNKFRAVLTIFGNFKVMEIRFDDLSEDKTNISISVNDDNRHNIDDQKFASAFFNLTIAMNRYADNLKARIVIGKMLGMM